MEPKAEARRPWPVVPWILLTFYFLLVNAVTALCTPAEMPAATFLLRVAAISVFWGLVEAECRPQRITFPLDMGFFLYVASWLVVPYYLWRAQRWRGLGKVLLIVAIWVVTYAVSVGLAWIRGLE
jgi:hypothetical protein